MPRIAVPPPKPHVATPITKESPPKHDIIKLGVEIEGVGNVKLNWDKPPVTTLHLKLEDAERVFKRMKLIRSPSFDEKPNERGVYFNPEEGESWNSRPAELVSSPHPLTADGLTDLRNSVWKMLRGSSYGKSARTEWFDDPRKALAPGAPNPPLATSRWGTTRNFTRVAGSLQTTTAVAVSKLLSTNAGTRQKVVDLLVGNTDKRRYLGAIAHAAVVAVSALDQSDPRSALLVQTRSDSLRLAFFMAFIDPALLAKPKLGKWEKDRLGCNIKGQSSFAACGVSDAAIVFQDFFDLGFKQRIVNALRGAGVQADLVNALNTHLSVLDIGRPGLSMQTLHEQWNALRNFYTDDQRPAETLHLIVEVREKTAPLNVEMCKFLNTAMNGGLPTYLTPADQLSRTRHYTVIREAAGRFIDKTRILRLN